MIKVLIVEDSVVAQEHLAFILGSDPQIKVIGVAVNGEEALDFLRRKTPDVITMDIHMPGIDGFEVTRRIMETKPLPIIIVSSAWNPKDIERTFHAIEAGAVAVIEKPKGLGHPEYEDMARHFRETVRLMSEVKVVRRWPKRPAPVVGAPPAITTSSEIGLVAVGASTGGPPVLQTIFSELPKDFSVPVVVVQHIAPGFLPGMVDWLNRTSALPVKVATHLEHLVPGHIYFAPDGLHMGVTRNNRVALNNSGPENGLRPSVSYLFRSVATVFSRNAAGVLLTGMGRDGAEELKMMKDAGAVTIAQDKESSVIHGMPGEAIKLDAATYVFPPCEIARTLGSIVRKRGAHEEGGGHEE